MSDSENHIEKMHQQLRQMAEREQMLINALDEALGRADRKLLDDVRSVTANHEARRAIILSELQTLAHRIGRGDRAPGAGFVDGQGQAESETQSADREGGNEGQSRRGSK